jgi:hypothetical protein
MSAEAGKRYVSPAGVELIVTKGAPGVLSDGEVALFLKEEAPAPIKDESARAEPLLQLGKRYRSVDGEVELLVIKPGVCDLRYDGTPMQMLMPRTLPSAD